MARPVVSTTIGAEGIGAENGRHLLVADTADSFAAAVIGLLDDSVRARQLGVNGRLLVQERYDWVNVGRTVAGCIDEMVGVGRE